VTALQIRLAPASIAAGGRLDGRILWSLARAPEITVRLTWQTRGKGTTDEGDGPSTEIRGTAAAGDASFALTAPTTPPSFSGRLISVIWYLTATDRVSGETAGIEVVIGPNGREIRLS
jgi:hypothetical protein